MVTSAVNLDCVARINRRIANRFEESYREEEAFAFVIALVLNGGFVMVEAVYGFLIHSQTLLAIQVETGKQSHPCALAPDNLV